MKKRMLAVMLPVAAFVALAGTGFGVWVFNTNSTATAYGDFEVTDAVSMDKMILDLTDKKITLDQDTTNNMSDFAIGGKIGVTTIDTSKGMVGSANASGTYTYTGTGTDMSSLKANYNVTVTVGGGLATYIDVATIKVGTAEAVAAVSGAKKTFAQTFALTDTSDKKDLAITFKWNDGEKPQTMDAYKKMVTALADGTITVAGEVSDVAFVA
jgi:hypothetical protein